MSDKTIDEDTFAKLTYDERVEVVNDRVSPIKLESRITNPKQLIGRDGETFYIVISPYNENHNLGNSYLLPWVVGKVYEHASSEPLKEDDELTFNDGEIYLCNHGLETDNVMSLRDINIVPNLYNNHVSLWDENEAKAYMLGRKMRYDIDQDIDELYGKHPHHLKTNDIERLLEAEKELATQDK